MIEKVVFIGSKKIGLKALDAIFNFSNDKLKAIVTYDDSSDSRIYFERF